MNAGFQNQTARIYQFPVVERRRDTSARAENGQSCVIDLPFRPHYDVIDTCWYHQEAVSADVTKTN